MLNKFGELTQVGFGDVQTHESVIAEHDESAINEKFGKFAQQLKRVAPKANEFLYFTAIMMHAAEASTINSDGSPKFTKEGKPVEAKWEISNNGSWKWVCNDPSIKEYKNCFPPGTEILMEDGTVKNIEDIEIGDKVISHTGKSQKVLDKFITPHSGKLLELYIRNNRKILTTSNHPFYKLNVFTDRGNQANPKSILSMKSAKTKFEFTEAAELNKYDLLLSPVLEEQKGCELSEKQARLLGIFAAEGSYGKKYNKYQSVRFTFNINEFDTLAKFTIELAKECFPHCSTTICKPNNSTCEVGLTGSGVVDFFRNHVGEYSEHKSLSRDLLFGPKNIKMQFLIGWMEGDGCVEKEYGQFVTPTVSKNLANQARLMLNACGINHSLRFIESAETKIINPKYGECEVKDHYRIEIPATAAAELINLSNIKNFTHRGIDKVQNAFFENYALYTLTDKNEIDYDGLVYNFEVEEDNSYVANNIIVHNCNGDIFPEAELLKAYKKWTEKPLCVDHKSDQVDAVRGIILDTHYDRKHKRVIALCALDQKSFPELANGIRTGYKTAVSMGVRVAKAICTDCGTVASVERDFCQHMKYKSGYGEINTGLDPIELSIVVNGADPQAKIRTILAHANQLRNSLDEKSSELAKLAMNGDSAEKFKTLEDDLKKMSENLAALKSSLENEEKEAKEAKEAKEDKDASNDGAFAQRQDKEMKHFDNQSDMPEALQFPNRLAKSNNLTFTQNELKDLKESINSKFEDLENGLITLSHKIKEEIMSVKSKSALNKEGYFQGAGGVNEPTPHQVKYPKDPLNEQMRDHGDKQMVGIESMGPVDGLFPGDKEKKHLVQRAEAEERAMRRQAAVEKAKENLAKRKEAYWQGGGGVNEPTPGKKKYLVDPGNEKARKEDKPMVGAKPFPDVGDVDGLYPEDEKTKKMLQRASKLTGKFVRVAAEDGSIDQAQSGWEISRDGEPVLTLTVNEISSGNVDALYETIESKAFGLDLLKKVQKLGAEKTKSLYKKADQALAGLPAGPVDAGQTMPMPEMAPSPSAEPQAPEMGASDATDGDTKQVALALAVKNRDTASDLLEAVRTMSGEEAEMGELESLSQKAANANFTKLVSFKKTLRDQLTRDMKTAIAQLSASQDELQLAVDIAKDEPEIAQVVLPEAITEAKTVQAKARDLMLAFIQYGEGSESLYKKAQMLEESNKVEDLGMGNDCEMVDDMAKLDEALDAAKTVVESLEDIKEDEVLNDAEENEGAEDEMEDLNDVMMDVDPNSLSGKKVEIKAASLDLSTKEARAAARAKLAAESFKFSPILDESSKLADGLSLEVKPQDELGHVETVKERHEKMLDVAEAPVKVRKEASRLNDLIKAGKVSVADLDGLVAKGLDADVVKYWKQFWGQAGPEGSEFATELLKEHAKAQFNEEISKFKVKIARAYELTNEMVRRGMLADERAVIASYVDDVLTWNDEGFEAMKRVINKTPVRKTSSVFPTVGLIQPSEYTQAKTELSLQEELDRAFSVLSPPNVINSKRINQ